MKKAFSLVILLLTFFSVSTLVNAQTVEGNGKITTQNRTVPAFTGLKITGGFEVVLTQGNKESLKLEAEENTMSHIETEVSNGILNIKTKGVKNAKKLKVYVTVRDLQSLELSGGIKLASTNTITANKLNLELAGGINLEMAIQVKELNAEIAGGTNTTLTGRADRVKLELAGASNLKASDLQTDYFTIEAAGVGNAEVNVAKELNVDAAGIVNVDYKGSPKVKHSGMGKVRPM
ncbi:head GIN domain-containing protein [Rufibacter roseus]|uniref:Head GIN domain-containing protein n=1 Tax=Rufibacter roseus TaxID=1567108 RepID=A0ABW2DFR8_9BACT|nr:head GIN domain-containing protein [Rufibacter roseus]